MLVLKLIPRCRAYSALAYSYAYRAEAPLRDMRMGVPAIADLDAAREVSDWYDAATSAMPFDWWEKRTILWAGLRMCVLASSPRCVHSD